jgi:hypothetical protein
LLHEEPGARFRVTESGRLAGGTENKCGTLNGKTEEDRRIYLVPKPVPIEAAEGRGLAIGDLMDGHFIGVQVICFGHINI